MSMLFASDMDEEVSNLSDMENVEMTTCAENNTDMKMEGIEEKIEKKIPENQNASNNNNNNNNGHNNNNNNSNSNSHSTRNWTMAKVQVGYDITRKGERSLVVDGYKFTKSRDGTNNRVFWRCSRRECKATAVTVCDRVEHVRAIHAHDPPLAAEFFSSTEKSQNQQNVNGTTNNNVVGNYSNQRCELQEVRFNTSATNSRGIGGTSRRRTTSKSETENTDEALSNGNGSGQGSVKVECSFKLSPATTTMNGSNAPNTVPTTATAVSPFITVTNPSVKEQVRDFILRNTSGSVPGQQTPILQQTNGSTHTTAPPPAVIVPPTMSQNNTNGHNSNSQKVAVTQFLITQPPGYFNTNNNNNNNNNQHNGATTNGHSIHSNNSVFNFSDSPNQYSDSTSELNSLKSTPRSINEIRTSDSTNRGNNNNNSAQIEQLLQLLLNSSPNSNNPDVTNNQYNQIIANELMNNGNGAGHLSNLTNSTFGSLNRTVDPHSLTTTTGSTNTTEYHSPSFSRHAPLHWKKERLRRDSESAAAAATTATVKSINPDSNYDYQLYSDGRKRKSPPLTHQVILGPMLDSCRPSITAKLIGVVQKLGSELSPESVVPQEVFEKCTAIKTCLETLEKLHSLSSSTA